MTPSGYSEWIGVIRSAGDAALNSQSRVGLKAAVSALASDTANRSGIVAELKLLIDESSSIGNGAVPDSGDAAGHQRMVGAAVAQQAAVQALLGIRGFEEFLDDQSILNAIDSTGMLNRLAAWPSHITTMRDRALSCAQEFKRRYGSNFDPRQIQVYGVGGSGAPHDLTAQILRNFGRCGIPINVFHSGNAVLDTVDESTVVLLSSFSGRTEETIHVYDTLNRQRDARFKLVGIGQPGSSSSELIQKMRSDGYPTIELPHESSHPSFVIQPRESVCLQLVSSLVFLCGLGLPARIGRPAEPMTIDALDIPGICRELPALRGVITPEQPLATNPAKQLALFLLYGVNSLRGRSSPPETTASCAVTLKLNSSPISTPSGLEVLRAKRIPFVISDRQNFALAHEVRTQFHERSKLNGVAYDAPECLHNLVESIRTTTESAIKGLDADPWTYYFLRSVDEEPRVGQRLDETIQRVLRGRATFAEATFHGANPFHRALVATYFNAHVSTYLAILNGYDPLPVPTMSWLKNVMRDLPRPDDAD